MVDQPETTISPSRQERIFFTGMMGCGKSSVGSRLAALLGVPYLDNDALLAAREGAELLEVAAEGREHLHRIESAIAERLAATPAPLIGGIAASVIEDPRARARLRGAGSVVYLRARPETLLARVRATPRPWLDKDPAGWIAATLARRAPLFTAAADLIVDTDGRAPDAVAAQIAAWWRGAPARPAR